MCYDLIVTCYLLPLGEHKYADTFRKAFSYGTFLQYLRSPGLNALPCRPTVSHEHWLWGLFLLTYCTNEPISARISAILQRLLHDCRAALFLSSDSSYLCNCRKTSYAMTHCLTTNTKNDAEHFQGNQHGRPASQRIAKIYRLKNQHTGKKIREREEGIEKKDVILKLNTIFDIPTK